MIGRINGTLLEKNPPEMLIDVGGVGYELEAPMSTFYSLPTVGDTVSLHIHMIVRDDAHLLFGFDSKLERHLFRALLKVSGVGARVALAILSGMSVEDFSACITRKDVATLTRIPGVGKKTADRLILEMEDKLPDDAAHLPGNAATVPAANRNPGADTPRSQAIDALVALGYKPADATRLVETTGQADAPVEEIIRAALKSINP